MKSGTGALATLPLLPLRDVVVFPHMVIPLFVGREKSISALDAAMSAEKKILLVAQRSAAEDDPGQKEIYKVGTVANVLQLLKLPDGTVKVLVEGSERALVEAVTEHADYLAADVRLTPGNRLQDKEGEALVRACMRLFEQYVNLGKKVPAEVLSALSGIDEPGRLADLLAIRYPNRLMARLKMKRIAPSRNRCP